MKYIILQWYGFCKIHEMSQVAINFLRISVGFKLRTFILEDGRSDRNMQSALLNTIHIVVFDGNI